jgi:hypothetical protein
MNISDLKIRQKYQFLFSLFLFEKIQHKNASEKKMHQTDLLLNPGSATCMCALLEHACMHSHLHTFPHAHVNI